MFFQNLQENTHARVLFFKQSCSCCFPVNFAKFLRIPFLIEHLPWLAASLEIAVWSKTVLDEKLKLKFVFSFVESYYWACGFQKLGCCCQSSPNDIWQRDIVYSNSSLKFVPPLSKQSNASDIFLLVSTIPQLGELWLSLQNKHKVSAFSLNFLVFSNKKKLWIKTTFGSDENIFSLVTNSSLTTFKTLYNSWSTDVLSL